MLVSLVSSTDYLHETAGPGPLVSPLNALMYEEVGKFQERELKATIFTSNQSIEDIFVTMNSFGESQLFYFSPEALLRSMPLWREILKPWQGRIVALVVDEAHLVEKWYVVPMYSCQH